MSEHEVRPTAVVAGALIAALLGGVLLKSSVENATTIVDRSGIAAVIPEGWLVNSQTDERPIEASNPQVPDERVLLGVISESVVPLSEIAATDNRNRSALLQGYRVLAEAPTHVGGTDAYEVRFALLAAGASPSVIWGDRLYFARGDQIFVASVQSPADRYQKSLPSFERFITSVVGTVR